MREKIGAQCLELFRSANQDLSRVGVAATAPREHKVESSPARVRHGPLMLGSISALPTAGIYAFTGVYVFIGHGELSSAGTFAAEALQLNLRVSGALLQ